VRASPHTARRLIRGNTLGKSVTATKTLPEKRLRDRRSGAIIVIGMMVHPARTMR
jgi:hypothetical protein